jgi:hypothetical protein
MSSIKDFDLLLPQLPTEEEWMEAIDGLKGLTKEATIARAKGYNLLADFNEPKATFERISWINLWSKAMVALESAMPAFQEGLNWILQTILRSTFEWTLHAYVLVEPIFDLVDLEKSSHKVIISSSSRIFSYKETIKRLRAYAAWCLWSDKASYNEIIHPKTLDGIWDPNPAKKIIENKKDKEGYERFFGQLSIETDEDKLKKGRHDMERVYKDKIAKIDNWLQAPELRMWSNKILEISRQKKGAVSYFNLFDPEATVKKRLNKIGLRFGYCQYSKSSMALHGSSMDHFVTIDDSKVAPKLKFENQADESLFENVISDCNRLFFLLGYINHRVLQNKKVRQ